MINGKPCLVNPCERNVMNCFQECLFRDTMESMPLRIKGWPDRASHDGAPNREVGPPLPLLGALAGLAGLPGAKGGNRI